MRPLVMAVFYSSFLLVNASCSVNILSTFADKKTNPALYEQAMLLINSGDYTGALAKIALITPPFRTDRKVLTLEASAYAGRGGLNFIDLVQALQNVSPPATTLFTVLLQSFQ